MPYIVVLGFLIWGYGVSQGNDGWQYGFLGFAILWCCFVFGRKRKAD